MSETKYTFCRVCEATCGPDKFEALSGMSHYSGILVDVRGLRAG